MLTSRRSWLQGGWLASVSGLFPALAPAAPSKPTVYDRLGLRPVVNFKGTMTTLGASKQWQECFEAQAEAAREFIVLEELQEAIGERLAKLCNTEAAMVSTGAAGAIAIGTYACVAGDNPKHIRQVPDLTGMKNEVIIQKVHRISYDHAVRGAGVKIVEVETADALRNAINDRTAMIYCLPGNNDDREWGDWVRLPEMVAIAKPKGVPILADCANCLPPWDNIPKIAATGIDLLCMSGGKHMRGPQSAGILAGRKDLVRKAALNTNPHSDSQGRPMKVGREDMVALWTACEKYAKLDFAAINRQNEKQADYFVKSLSKIKGVRTEKLPSELIRKMHRVGVSWDETKLGLTKKQVEARLMDGDPRIAVAGGYGHHIVLCCFMNEPGEEEIVVDRLKKIFKA